jgi:hypothetical protein
MAPIEPQQIIFDEDRGKNQNSNADLPPISRHLSIDTEDISAFGAMLLCIGAVIAALIVSVGFVLGKVEGKAAEHIILGCVGGAAIAGVVGAILGKRKRKRNTK